jgi:2'-5' RNA ligase
MKGNKQIVANLERDIDRAKRSKKPSIFLGGTIKYKEWRKELKEEFGDRFFFMDPVDPNWEAEENIYDELAGAATADYVIFYKGGEGSEKEQDFMDALNRKYKSFDNIEKIKEYLKSLPKTKKRACVGNYLYKQAAMLLIEDLTESFIDGFLKQADSMSGKVHREKEKRIILNSIPEECKGLKPIIIKQGILREAKNNGEVISYARIRMKKDPGKKPQYSLGVKNFKLSQEAETEISKQMFDSFYPDFLDRPQEKERYKLPNGWEVDILEDKIVAEYEQKKGERANIPESWDVKEEKNYKMAFGDLSSLQIDIPSTISRRMLQFAKSIPLSELASDGVEKDSHVTVLYGLLDEKPDQVKEILKDIGPFQITLQDTDIFSTSPTFDVVFHKVNSPGLHRLNELLRKKCPHRLTHPNYNPHATIAYVKKGNGPKYIGNKIPGATFTAKEATFSSKNGKKTKIRLGKA